MDMKRLYMGRVVHVVQSTKGIMDMKRLYMGRVVMSCNLLRV